MNQMNREEEKQTFQVFCSYSHEDRNSQKKLAKHLAALRRTGMIELWYDEEIRAGDKWSDEISENLEKADIILLLVSANFISSDYCYSVEMKRALELHESKQAIVIPIIVKTCYWEITPLADLQALPANAKPVSRWLQQDEAWTDISKGIKKTIDRLKKERRTIQKEKMKERLIEIQNFRLPASDIAKNLLREFLKTWSNWSFSIARIRGWGARQPGYDEFSDFDTNLLEKALKDLEEIGEVVSQTSSKTGGILYEYKK